MLYYIANRYLGSLAMALNLFEYIKIEPAQDEYAVEILQQKLQNEEIKQEQAEMRHMRQNMLDETTEYANEISRQIQEETDASKQFLLKKIHSYVSQVGAKTREDMQQEDDAWQKKTETIDYRMNEFAQYWLQQEPYAESFAQAYRIKDEAFKRGDDAKIKFVPFSEEVDTHRLKPEGRWYPFRAVS